VEDSSKSPSEASQPPSNTLFLRRMLGTLLSGLKLQEADLEEDSDGEWNVYHDELFEAARRQKNQNESHKGDKNGDTYDEKTVP